MNLLQKSKNHKNQFGMACIIIILMEEVIVTSL
jgi:hypothetical protein